MNAPGGVAEKRERLVSDLRRHNRILVALSGGVDSAVLLALAREAVGAANVLAVTGVSPSIAQAELEDARSIARSLGVAHELIHTREMDRPDYRANRGDRCFHCRSELFGLLSELATNRGFDAVAYGAITDDLGDHRPGMAAARDLGVLAPLVSSDIGKTDVRELARSLDIHIHEKPASACLASRIPIGTEVTPERLLQVERAEAALRRLGFRQLRVRHHGEIARLELDDEGLERVVSVRAEVSAAVREAGFRHVAVDLEGYRAGSLNVPGREPEALYSIAPARESGQ